MGIKAFYLQKPIITAVIGIKNCLLYTSFEYAKEAMKYGVRHYVLKPCNKSLISDCIVDVAKDCYARKRTRSLEDGHLLLTSSMHHNIVSSVISESLGQSKALPEIIRSYEPYLDFYSTPYQLFYVFYLEIGSLEVFLQELKQYLSLIHI